MLSVVAERTLLDKTFEIIGRNAIGLFFIFVKLLFVNSCLSIWIDCVMELKLIGNSCDIILWSDPDILNNNIKRFSRISKGAATC